MKKTIRQELKNLNAIELINFVSDKYHTAEKRNLSVLSIYAATRHEESSWTDYDKKLFQWRKKTVAKTPLRFWKSLFPRNTKKCKQWLQFFITEIALNPRGKTYLNYSQKYGASLITIIHPRMPRAGWNSARPYYTTWNQIPITTCLLKKAYCL